jgi:AcrR family transcriptional regulator
MKKSNTRLKMTQVALDLFHQKGINATSVDEILEKSGTGKSQLYHYFKNKDGLIYEVLQYFYGQLKNNQLPVKLDIETWEDLERWLKFFVDFERSINCERSCPIGTIGNDLSNSQEPLRQEVKLIFEFTRHSLAKFFSSMRTKGKLPKSVNPEALAALCFTVQQGGLLISKIERDYAPFEEAVTQLLKLLKSLRI